MAKVLKSKKPVIQDNSNSLNNLENFKKAIYPLNVINNFKRLINQLNIL